MNDIYISVIVPAFNEESNIKNLITELDNFLKTLNRNYEIIVVDDGSNDSTVEVINSLVNDMRNLRLVSHDHNRGIGAALRTGYESAKGDLITWVAADGQNPPYEIRKFLKHIDNNNMVVSIYSKRKDSFLRHLLSRCWRILIKVIVNYDLETQGPYLFKRELLKDVLLCSETGLMNIEFPNKVKRTGFKVETISVICEHRKGGKSKVLNPCTVINILEEMIKLRFGRK